MLTPYGEAYDYYLWFVKHYCQRYSRQNPRPALSNPEVINIRWNTLVADFAKVDQKAVTQYLRDTSNTRSKYRDFYLTTFWWYIIRHKRMLMDGALCTGKNCTGNYSSLEIHHPNYDHKGEEVLFMDSIQTLCPACHNMEHPDKKRRKKRKSNSNLIKARKEAKELKEFHRKIKNLTLITVESDDELRAGIINDLEKIFEYLNEM